MAPAPTPQSGSVADTRRIPPCSGRSVELNTGDVLVIIDPEGQQVSDLTAFARDDLAEYLSSGRSIDYAAKLWLSTGDLLYSNRSRPMLTIVEDTCGRHDFTLTPCSKEMFSIIYGETEGRPGCEGNLASALAPYQPAEILVSGCGNRRFIAALWGIRTKNQWVACVSMLADQLFRRCQ
ncbi:MAG: urea carboxylase-associated family protein, partial [Acidobacteria bacterium]|nr:urea carboxylase-associated family protein [Acidobacteriota bacterium]